MKWDNIQQLLRIAMYMAGGHLVAEGYLEDDAAVEAMVGAVVTLGGLAWWAYWNKFRDTEVDL